MNAYQPIPGVPGYEVNGLGQVRGRSGKILKHDPDGRVQVLTPRGPRRFFIGELLPRSASADAPALETSPDDQDAMRRRIDHLERVILEYEAAQGSFDPFGGDA